MTLSTAARDRIVRRLLAEAQRLQEWAVSENLLPDDPLRSFGLALTITEKDKTKTVIKHKKRRGQPKSVNADLQEADWDAISAAIQFSKAEAPWEIFQFFKRRGNALASVKALSTIPCLKKTHTPFSQVETQWLNSLLRRAGAPYRLRSAGRGQKAYRFFIIEKEDDATKSNERQLKLFESQ